MTDIKKTRNQNEAREKKLEKQVEDLKAEKNEGHRYKCTKCGESVNFHFIMKFIKDSGMCPSCFHE